jgi:hypothetical protein
MGTTSAIEVLSAFHNVSKTQEKKRNKYNYFIISSANVHRHPRQLTLRCRALIENLIVTQLLNKFSMYYKFRRLNTILKNSLCSYHEGDEPSPHNSTLFVSDPYSYYPLI